MPAYTDTLTATSILKEITDFVQEVVVPQEDEFLANGYGVVRNKLQAIRERAQELGLWTPSLPIAQGGMGLSLSHYAPISAALGFSPLGHYSLNCQAPDLGNMELLIQHGTPEQHEKYLQPLALGSVRSCFTMTEPEFAGSNPVHIATTARREGDQYIIDGHKWFATGADQSDFAIVMALTDPDASSAYERASLIIVPTATPGFEHVRRIAVMGETGSGPFSHSEIRYNACRVPVANRIGEEGAGFRLAQERLGPGRIHHCMRWLGICERAFDLMCRRAATRELAPGKLLGNRQTIQNWIAECRTEIDAARLLTLHTARKIDLDGAPAARREISQVKFHVATLMQRVLDLAIQTHGAAGITEDTVLSHWFRHERGARIYDGPDEVHKTVVARQVLARYGA